MTAHRIRTLVVAALVLCLFSACDDALAPYHPEISTATDNFQLQASNLVDLSSTLTYKWTNTGSQATVNHSTTTTAGTARLVVRDASHAVVYDKTLVPSQNEPTLRGSSGQWTIELHLTNYSGTLNFRVQKL